jgi:hypothetical protein
MPTLKRDREREYDIEQQTVLLELSADVCPLEDDHDSDL